MDTDRHLERFQMQICLFAKHETLIKNTIFNASESFNIFVAVDIILRENCTDWESPVLPINIIFIIVPYENERVHLKVSHGIANVIIGA